MEVLTTTVRPERNWHSPLLTVSRWLSVALLSLLAASVHAQSTESKLKAVCLLNFTRFVEFPAEAFADTNAPIVVGILGNDPCGNFLDELVQGESANGRSIVVHRYRTAEEAKSAHVLYISPPYDIALNGALTVLKGRPILTVGERSDSFVLRGGMAGIGFEEDKFRLRINLGAAQGAKLKINARLLRIAEIVKNDK